MKVKNILLTGDDGYNSVGTRILIHYLKKKYNIYIAATRLQQSGVGGKLSLSHPFSWSEIEVDGVKGVCVDGTPGDAVELARYYFNQIKFDVVISGINLGVNIGGSYPASGTLSAVKRALLLQLAQRTIALSIHVEDRNAYLRHHDGTDDLKSHLQYPGKIVYQLIELVIQNNFWNCELININLPSGYSNKIVFTRPIHDLTRFFDYIEPMNKSNKSFQYPFGVKHNEYPIEYDAGAVLKGYISITPCKSNLLNESVYQKMKKKTIKLQPSRLTGRSNN